MSEPVRDVLSHTAKPMDEKLKDKMAILLLGQLVPFYLKDGSVCTHVREYEDNYYVFDPDHKKCEII